MRRAREWTNALTRWCDAQPQMVSFTGGCLAHRAGIKQLNGAWSDALTEAQLARERCEEGMNIPAAGQAYYQQAELHRLRGDAAAEEAYRAANRYGREPQPGVALLRLARGDVDAAVAAIRRALGETSGPLKRAALLPAYVEIMLAAGDVEARATQHASWRSSASGREHGLLGAIAAYAGSRRARGGEPGRRWHRSGRRRASGRSSTRRTRPRASASSSARLPRARRRGLGCPGARRCPRGVRAARTAPDVERVDSLAARRRRRDPRVERP